MNVFLLRNSYTHSIPEYDEHDFLHPDKGYFTVKE